MTFARAIDHVRRILADGEWHEREEVVAAVMGDVARLDALEAARGHDYTAVRHDKQRQLSPQEFRAWVDAHPNKDLFIPTERGIDPAYGARLGMLQRINKANWIERTRISRPSVAGRAIVMIRKKE